MTNAIFAEMVARTIAETRTLAELDEDGRRCIESVNAPADPAGIARVARAMASSARDASAMLDALAAYAETLPRD